MGVFTKGNILFIVSCFVASPLLRAQSVGGTTSGAATYCATSNSGFISVTGYTGTSLTWQSTVDGLTWTNTGNTTPTQSYLNLAQTSCYRVVVQNGAFPPDTSTTTCITIYQPSAGGTISGGGTFCAGSGTGVLTLAGNTGNVQFWEYSTDGGTSWTTVPDTATSLAYAGITQNTLYRAVVQNGPSCPADTSSTVEFLIDPASEGGFISGSDTVCPRFNSGTLQLSAYTGMVTAWLVSTDFGTTWNPVADTTALLSYSGLVQTTVYRAIVQSGSCSADTSLPAAVLVLVPAPVFAGNDTAVIAGQSAQLHGFGTGSVSWSPAASLDNNTVYTPLATPAVTTTYTMTVTDTSGCISSDAVVVTVNSPSFNGTIANLFSPNGDGVNDTWYVQNIQDYPGNEVHIYNIYGNEVFSTKGYANDWKGTYNGADLPDGTYYFVLKLSPSEPAIKGSVDILRNK